MVMTLRRSTLTVLAGALALALYATNSLQATEAPPAPLTIGSSRVSLAGTSNIHAFTASTTNVRLVNVQFTKVEAATFWDDVVKPGAIEAFEIAIGAATLTSPKEGLDKNMHKALKTDKHADITFKLIRLEGGTAPGGLKAIGTLQIAGVEREIAFDLKTERTDATLTVKGEVPLLMTDYGITPPKAMLGMLKTDPKIVITFETVLALPLT
jgi:polyisoprenoid-binding protein YceI